MEIGMKGDGKMADVMDTLFIITEANGMWLWGCFVMDGKWEGTLRGMNEDETLLEYFGRFDSGMFQRARVRIGTRGEERKYEHDIWVRNDYNRADELDWIKGQAG
jgi:hypothetical protein